MVKDGLLYAVGLTVVAGVLWGVTHSWILVLFPLLLMAFFLWFFRDPTRVIPAGLGVIVSPADGVVTAAEMVETNLGKQLRLSVFLSVFDVHVNRAPIAGTVSRVEHHKGGFINAMKPESGLTNEQTLIVVDGGKYQVSFKQIAGLLARRIVCNLQAGDRVERGQRMGLIKFGSRCDVLMPAEAELRVSKGTRVKGGSTVLAVMPLEKAN